MANGDILGSRDFHFSRHVITFYIRMADNHHIQWFSSTNDRLELGTNDHTKFAAKFANVTSHQYLFLDSKWLHKRLCVRNKFWWTCRMSWICWARLNQNNPAKREIHCEIVIMLWHVVGLRLTHLFGNLFCLLMKLALINTYTRSWLNCYEIHT